MTNKFYKALAESLGCSRQMQYYWKKKGLTRLAKNYLAAHSRLKEFEGNYWITIRGNEFTVTEELILKIKEMKTLNESNETSD